MKEIELFNNKNLKKIRICSCEWNEIIDNPEMIYKAIVDLLLDEVNLFYFASQKESTKTLTDTKEYIKKLLEKGILNNNLQDILKNIGWDKENIKINNTIFQGDLSEYLMCIIIDELTEYKTLISKVSLKTSPNMPAYGNDNIFFDYDNDTLYYGESKFYQDTLSGINAALKSLEEHLTGTEISFIRSHTNTFIAHNGEQRQKLVETMETKFVDDISVKKLCFITSDDMYEKANYEELLLKKFGSEEAICSNCNEIIMIFLPIISKKGLLEYFEKRLEDYE